MNMFFQAYMGERNDHLVLMHNIMYRAGGSEIYRFADWEEEKVSCSDFNVFFHPDGEYKITGIPGNETWEGWRTLSNGRFDRNSVLADPIFEDAENGNFTVRPESPALAAGFVNIDQDSIGLLEDFPLD